MLCREKKGPSEPFLPNKPEKQDWKQPKWAVASIAVKYFRAEKKTEWFIQPFHLMGPETQMLKS